MLNLWWVRFENRQHIQTLENSRSLLLNIFATSECPLQAARDLCDAHIRKMGVESTQLLSTMINVLYKPSEEVVEQYRIMRSFNPLHPSCLWIQESVENVEWLITHTREILDIGLSAGLWKDRHLHVDRFHSICEYLEDNPLTDSVFSRKELSPTYLAMDSDLKEKYAEVIIPKQKNRDAVYQCSSWSLTTEAYREYINRKRFTKKGESNGILPIWTYQEVPTWYNPGKS